jgi:O-antigen/teichoic acid export membrane protein
LQQWGWAFLVAIGAVVLLLSNRSLGPVLWIWTVGSLIAVAIGYALRRPIILRPSPARTWALLAMGFPIMLSGLLGTLFLTADRWVAAARLDPTAAGTYGLASMISSAIFLVPGVIAQQQYPRLAMLKGANAPASKLRAAALRQSLLAAAASGASAIVAAPVVLIVIPWMLPAYAAAAGPAVLLSLGSVAIAGGTGPGNLMLVVGALWPYLAIQISCFAIAVALMWLGSGLAGTLGLAVGFVAGQTLLMLVLIVVARRYVRGKAEVR